MRSPDPWAKTVADAIAGNQDAFAQLFRNFWPWALSLCRLHSDNEDDARDAAQQAFVSVHRYLHNFRFQSKFSVWLHQICINECRAIWRKRQSRPKTISFDTEPIIHPNLVNNASDRLPLLQALDKLSPYQRTVLTMHLAEGHSYVEIGAMLGTTPLSVKSAVHAGVVKIRTALKEKNENKEKGPRKKAGSQNKATQEVAAQAAQAPDGGGHQAHRRTAAPARHPKAAGRLRANRGG